jgi:hypothetical protein
MAEAEGGEVQVGSARLRRGERFREMVDSTELLRRGDIEQLRRSESACACGAEVCELCLGASRSLTRRAGIEVDGYALLRGVLDRERVLGARKIVLDTLAGNWGAIDTSQGRSVMDGYVKDSKSGMLLTGAATCAPLASCRARSRARRP